MIPSSLPSLLRPVAARTALIWIAVAFVIAAAYWLCLRYLFPVYFAPLSAFHVDFYEYASFRDKPLAHILRYPRPAAYLCMKLLGWSGLTSVMAGGIVIALINILLTVFLVSRFTLTNALWLPVSAAIYSLLLFAQPDFYFEHRHDLPAEVSYFFLLVSLICWTAFANSLLICARAQAALYAALTISAAVFFVFSKETYFLSALCLVVGISITDRRNWKLHAGFLVFLALLEAASFLWTAHLNGPFINTHATADNSYKIDLSPQIVWQTTWFYFSRFFTPFLTLVLAWLLFLLRKDRRLLAVAVVFLAAGLAAYAPHAVLPNHLFEEYAWVGAPLILAPVLMAGERRFSWVNISVTAALALLTLFGPWSYRQGYRSAELAYEVRQDQLGLPVARSVQMLHAIPTGSRVLVVGLEATYVPFLAESFLLAEFGDRTYWTLLTGPGIAPRRTNRVARTVTYAQVKLDSYDELVTYDAEGYLKSIRPTRDIPERERQKPYLLLPGLRVAAELVEMYPREAYRKFIAADICLNWGDWEDARQYLQGAERDGAEKDATFRDLSTRLDAGPRSEPAPQPAQQAPAYTLETRPSHLTDTDGTGLVDTELVWNISPSRPCEIRVGAPDGKLFAVASVSGSGKTAKWVRNGMTFYLQDVSGGKALTAANTLAQLVVVVSPR